MGGCKKPGYRGKEWVGLGGLEVVIINSSFINELVESADGTILAIPLSRSSPSYQLLRSFFGAWAPVHIVEVTLVCVASDL